MQWEVSSSWTIEKGRAEATLMEEFVGDFGELKGSGWCQQIRNQVLTTSGWALDFPWMEIDGDRSRLHTALAERCTYCPTTSDAWKHPWFQRFKGTESFRCPLDGDPYKPPNVGIVPSYAIYSQPTIQYEKHPLSFHLDLELFTLSPNPNNLHRARPEEFPRIQRTSRNSFELDAFGGGLRESNNRSLHVARYHSTAARPKGWGGVWPAYSYAPGNNHGSWPALLVEEHVVLLN